MSATVADRLTAIMGQRIKPEAAERFAWAVSERAPWGADRPTLCRPAQAWKLLKRHAGARTERLIGLYLDAQNRLLQRRVLTVGALNVTRTQPREVFWPAIGCGALGVILAHNHPSGCLEPSEEDLAFTEAIKRAGEILGVAVYDHLVIARGGYTSLRERGVL